MLWYIDPIPNDSGAYSPPQSTPFDGATPLTDEQSDMLVQHNGFVLITSEPDPKMEGSTVTVTPNTEAWEAWKQAESDKPQPEPEPTLEDRVTAVEVAMESAPQYAAAMRAFASTSTAIPDLYALEMPDFFPLWDDLLVAGEALTKGTILNDGGQLYRVIQDQVIPLEHQPPHGQGMTAVYQPIDHAHAGTREDPIPAKAGMEYIYGRYYLDPEDGRTYLCKRTGEAEGGTVTLQYLPHALVGHYFEAVT